MKLFSSEWFFSLTYNSEGRFSQWKSAILFDIKSQEDLNNWSRIKLLAALHGIKYVDFDPDAPNYFSFERGYQEVKVGSAPERTQYLPRNIHVQIKQYILKHHVTVTIHGSMGDNMNTMATEVPQTTHHLDFGKKENWLLQLSEKKEKIKYLLEINLILYCL